MQNIKWLWQFMTTYCLVSPSHYKWGGSQVGQNLVDWAHVDLTPHSSMANGSWGKNNIMVIDPNILVSLTSIKSLYYSQLISSPMCTFLNLLIACLQHTTPKHVTTTYMPINSKCKLPLFWFLPITLLFVA